MEGQWKAIEAAMYNVPLYSRVYVSGTFGNAARAGGGPPVAVFDYARVGSRRPSLLEVGPSSQRSARVSAFAAMRQSPRPHQAPGRGRGEGQEAVVPTPEFWAKNSAPAGRVGHSGKVLGRPPQDAKRMRKTPVIETCCPWQSSPRAITVF